MNDNEKGVELDPKNAGPDAGPQDRPNGGADVEAIEGELLGGDLAELREKLSQAEAQAAEYLDNWRRAVADLSNARKRMQREQDELRRSASARVLERLLPVVDDVDRAFANVPAELAGSDWVEGFRLIQRKLQALLESEGVTTILAAGEQFDPKLHYAVTHEDAEGLAEGQIIAEVARGYKLDDKVLRPSMVRVAKGDAKG
jgi:molecular chaperone GrpE